MATHKSAVKRIKTAEQARQRNRRIKTTLRAAVKELRARKKPEEKAAAYKETARLLDVAACKGVIHKNKAARTKSRLARALKPK